jgi:hypothetical protein
MTATMFTWRELATFVTVAHPAIDIAIADKSPKYTKGVRIPFLSMKKVF